MLKFICYYKNIVPFVAIFISKNDMQEKETITTLVTSTDGNF